MQQSGAWSLLHETVLPNCKFMRIFVSVASRAAGRGNPGHLVARKNAAQFRQEKRRQDPDPCTGEDLQRRDLTKSNVTFKRFINYCKPMIDQYKTY
ncbi:hypothetical protein Mboo_1468 [Methanoregula boonei 6A8]|uniref:Uncharacterized protein n=1 Tax=Methanoregula boonei (strain DSM 21154 / JCM 14090 / 6A8) TaxID=456442 RepID=A7I8C5_METB6|nr:hypothetical protein Mboo_1468 [Methanoregula boonei 6A8]